MPGKGNLPFLLSMLIGEACFNLQLLMNEVLHDLVLIRRFLQWGGAQCEGSGKGIERWASCVVSITAISGICWMAIKIK